MVTEHPSPMADGGSVGAEKPADGSLPHIKCQGKVPKKAHKAERERLKRDQLNDLFSELGSMLGPDRQNNGKATILSDTTRILCELLAEVESLRKENTALLTESRYVTSEKNELRDEDKVLHAQITELRDELRMRMGYGPAWSHDPDESTLPVPPGPANTTPPLQQPAIVGRIPTEPPRELQLFPEAATTINHEPPSLVRRPHARYLAPSDSWMRQILPDLPRGAAQEEQCRSDRTGSCADEGWTEHEP